MTHTLHRTGCCRDLKADYLIVAMPDAINREGSKEKLVKIIEIALEEGAINAGDTQQGNIHSIGEEGLMESIVDGGVINCVFDGKDKLNRFLKRVKEENLGISVVASGLFSEVEDCLDEAGLVRHTVAVSLGIWGCSEKLPSREIIELNSMCGHGMVTPRLIESLIDRVREGKITPEKAGLELTKPCVCGAFNPVRAGRLIAKIAAE